MNVMRQALTLQRAYRAGVRWAENHPDATYGTYQDLYAAKIADRGEDWATLWMQGVVTTYFREPARCRRFVSLAGGQQEGPSLNPWMERRSKWKMTPRNSISSRSRSRNAG